MTGVKVCSTCESNKSNLNLGTEQTYIFSVPPKDHRIHNRGIFVILSKYSNRQTTVLGYELYDRWASCAMHLHLYKIQNPITVEHFMPKNKKVALRTIGYITVILDLYTILIQSSLKTKYISI